MRKAIEVDPDSGAAHGILADVYEAKGRCKEWIDEVVRSMEIEGEVEYAQALQRGFTEAGCPGAARHFLERNRERAKHEYVQATQIAGSYLRLGEKEEALQYLEKGYQAREAWIPIWRSTPSGTYSAPTRDFKVCSAE